MLNILRAAGLAVLFATAPAFAQEETLRPEIPADAEIRDVIAKAVDGFIRPGYHDFHAAAGALAGEMDALCAAPSPDALAQAKAAFAEAALSWARIEIVRTGPAIEDNRFERILFYPDRKSTGLKQVQGLLAKPDDSTTAPGGLSGKSVAMQGFGALEFVLAGTGSEALATEADGFRCRYGRAIAQNIEHIAGELVVLWEAPDGVQQAWKEPGPDNPLFRNAQEAMTALLGILVHGAEMVRDQRIETFYKGEDSQTFPRQALFWRSGNTWTMVKGNLEGLGRLMHVSDMAALLPEDQTSIVGSVDFVLKSMLRVTGEMNSDIEAAVSDDSQRQKLDFLLVNGRDLIGRLNDQYGGAIGLTSGFSFSDGD
ncbi:imelysin family protein [Pseudorhizobium marinum]|uniref:imelysin family protein n=1 Tax=Pseudorhizobium marinum TaxID=1496690 RepID=UPI000496D09B|nr:imelysin family protein [Pseudorhizobium marinum]